MKAVFKQTLLAMTCGSALFLTACNDDDNKITGVQIKIMCLKVPII
jgi:hypothetical protein